MKKRLIRNYEGDTNHRLTCSNPCPRRICGSTMEYELRLVILVARVSRSSNKATIVIERFSRCSLDNFRGPNDDVHDE